MTAFSGQYAKEPYVPPPGMTITGEIEERYFNVVIPRKENRGRKGAQFRLRLEKGLLTEAELGEVFDYYKSCALPRIIEEGSTKEEGQDGSA